MRKEWRFWMWNAAELTLGLILMGIVMAVLAALLDGRAVQVWYIGFAIMIMSGIWMFSNSSHSRKTMSFGISFGSTRRRSFAGLQITFFLTLAGMELIQILLLLLPWGDTSGQHAFAAGTPLLVLFMSGVGYITAILDLKSEKIFKIATVVIMMLCGGCSGLLCSAVLAEALYEGNVPDYIEKFMRYIETNVLFTAIAVSLAVYLAGSFCFWQASKKMDVKI